MLIKIPKGWQGKEWEVTPEGIYLNRRELVKTLGLGGIGLSVGCGLSVTGGDPFNGVEQFVNPYDDYFPVVRNNRYEVNERPLTDEIDATQYNNFYEFSVQKTAVWQLVGEFRIEPWTIEVAGLCGRPGTYDIYDLLNRFELEERIYRHRCVETWAMTVPWSGFALRDLVSYLEPSSDASYIRFVTADAPSQMPGMIDRPEYPWPYYEGLRMDEAMNELSFMAAGLYGRGIPRQNGAPLRLVVPWKYGYKSIKSIVRIEFLDQEPATFWSDLAPSEYPFISNVDPDVPHPRWSQATETLLTSREEVDTLKYNGYGEFVADLYE